MLVIILSTCLLGLLLTLLLLRLLVTRVSRASAAGSQANSMASAATVSQTRAENEHDEDDEDSQKQSNVEENPPAGEGWTVVGAKFSHPIYKRLSCLNGELNALSLNKLKEKLDTLNLSSTCVDTITASCLLHAR